MATPELYLLKGPMPELKSQSKKQLKAECQMWRKLWQWAPSEVKYYIARVGSQVALTMRNYKRHMGTLLGTHWVIDEIELGVYEKEYDVNTGQYYFEKKIVKTKLGGVIDIQWIAERKSEAEVLAETEEAAEEPKEEETVLQ